MMAEQRLLDGMFKSNTEVSPILLEYMNNMRLTRDIENDSKEKKDPLMRLMMVDKLARTLMIWGKPIPDDVANYMYEKKRVIYNSRNLKFEPLIEFVHGELWPRMENSSTIMNIVLRRADLEMPCSLRCTDVKKIMDDNIDNMVTVGTKTEMVGLRLAALWNKIHNDAVRGGPIGTVVIMPDANDDDDDDEEQSFEDMANILDHTVSKDIEFINYNTCEYNPTEKSILKEDWERFYHAVMVRMGFTIESALRFFRVLYWFLNPNAETDFRQKVLDKMGDIRLWSPYDKLMNFHYPKEKLDRVDRDKLFRILMGVRKAEDSDAGKSDVGRSITMLFDVAHLFNIIDIDAGSYAMMDIILDYDFYDYFYGGFANYSAQDSKAATRGFGMHRKTFTKASVGMMDTTIFLDRHPSMGLHKHPEFMKCLNGKMVRFAMNVDAPFIVGEVRRRLGPVSERNYDLFMNVTTEVIARGTAKWKSFAYIPDPKLRSVIATEYATRIIEDMNLFEGSDEAERYFFLQDMIGESRYGQLWKSHTAKEIYGVQIGDKTHRLFMVQNRNHPMEVMLLKMFVFALVGDFIHRLPTATDVTDTVGGRALMQKASVLYARSGRTHQSTNEMAFVLDNLVRRITTGESTYFIKWFVYIIANNNEEDVNVIQKLAIVHYIFLTFLRITPEELFEFWKDSIDDLYNPTVTPSGATTAAIGRGTSSALHVESLRRLYDFGETIIAPSQHQQ